MTVNIKPPFVTFFDTDGNPLEGGFIYIGTSGLNPLIGANQIAIYTDSGLTTLVAQPIRTLGGYPVASGTPINLFTGLTDYSILVTNKNGEVVYSSLVNSSLTGYIRTPTEIAQGVFPIDYTYPENDVDRYNDVDAPIIYLQLVSALKGGWPFDALRAIPRSKWTAMRGYTSVYDTQPQLALLFGDVNAARRCHIYMTDGLWNIGAPLANLPLKLRLEGSDRRSFGGPGASGAGTIIQSTFSTDHAIKIIQGGLTQCDIELQHLGIYGTGLGTNIDGIAMTNVSGVTLKNMVVAAFTRNNIAFSGGNYLICDNLYSAQAGNAAFYIDGEYCTLNQISADAGIYSVYATALGFGLEICGRSHLEGPALRCLHILANQFKMIGGLLRPFANTPAWSAVTTYVPGNFVVSGGVAYYCIQKNTNQIPPNATYWYTMAGATGAVNGAYINNDRAALIGTEIFGSNSVGCIGLDSDVGANGYRYSALDIRGFDLGLRLKEGIGQVSGSTILGNVTGAELIGGTYVGILTANTIGGVTNSILHTSGNMRWKVDPSNRLCDAANPQTFKEMTIVAGTPIVTGYAADATGPATVASAANITIPPSCPVVLVSGVVNVTSVTAHLGRTVTLLFQGVLTFTDGGNLKLNGNFVTTADDTITITCPDGVNWYEVSRSVN